MKLTSTRAFLASIVIFLFLLAVALCSSTLHAQTPTPTSPPTPPPAPSLPGNWVGSGASYGASVSPKWGGWMSLVIAVNKANAIYSYSSYDVQPVAGKIPMTSARTGVATILKQIGPVYVLGLATAGGAATSTATTGSFAGGGAVVYRYKTSPWTGIFEVQVVSNTGRTIRLGIGRTF